MTSGSAESHPSLLFRLGLSLQIGDKMSDYHKAAIDAALDYMAKRIRELANDPGFGSDRYVSGAINEICNIQHVMSQVINDLDDIGEGEE